MATIDLPSRYELRTLTLDHIEWASAIFTHGMLHQNRLWAGTTTTEEAAAGTYRMLDLGNPIMEHQIRSGHSLGIFDKEYKFKRPESEATGGKLYWDSKDMTATGADLLEQMDFPLISVAMSYDLSDPPPDPIGWIDCCPHAVQVFGELEEKDRRDPEVSKATGPNQVLMRLGTATRADVMGLKLMKKMAHFVMRKAADDGFRGIDIECFSPAVTHVWSNPPSPFQGLVVSEVDTDEFEVTNDNGEKVYPLVHAHTKISKVFVTLR